MDGGDFNGRCLLFTLLRKETMKIESKFCTDLLQSKRLLELGLKPETADMHYTARTRYSDGFEIPENERVYHLGFHYEEKQKDKYGLCIEVIPAWSLLRLMKIGALSGIGFYKLDDAYEICVSLIEERIRIGILNKMYLINHEKDRE